MFLFCFFLNNKTALQHITIQLCSIAYLMNRKNYCRAESSFLMRPRVRVGFGLTSGSGRVRAEPTRPDSIFEQASSHIQWSPVKKLVTTSAKLLVSKLHVTTSAKLLVSKLHHDRSPGKPTYSQPQTRFDLTMVLPEQHSNLPPF